MEYAVKLPPSTPQWQIYTRPLLKSSIFQTQRLLLWYSFTSPSLSHVFSCLQYRYSSLFIRGYLVIPIPCDRHRVFSSMCISSSCGMCCLSLFIYHARMGNFCLKKRLTDWQEYVVMRDIYRNPLLQILCWITRSNKWCGCTTVVLWISKSNKWCGCTTVVLWITRSNKWWGCTTVVFWISRSNKWCGCTTVVLWIQVLQMMWIYD